MTFEVRLEPRDVWVGLFWDRREDGLHLFVCPLPFVVLHCVFAPKPVCPACGTDHSGPSLPPCYRGKS